MKFKLFGTDGIRGKSNQYPILPNTVLHIGQALGLLLNKKEELDKNKQNNLNHKEKQYVLIGKDTRLSCDMIEMALASGLNSMGIHVVLIGTLPTPGIGFLTRNMCAQAGIVISASHNPYYDNGIKVFDNSGLKISTQWEKEIEDMLTNTSFEDHIVGSDKIGQIQKIENIDDKYISYIKEHFPLSKTLDGMHIVLDCANGACYKIAPRILKELGTQVTIINNQPDGFNINKECGACYPEKAASTVKKYKADLGISLDGDGDRLIMIDEFGQVVNGDHILAILALHAKKTGHLKNNKVVITEMSNLGLEDILFKNDITIIKANVGDRYVAEQMQASHCYLGGEPSGHILFLEDIIINDGLITALKILKIMKEKNKKLSQLKSFQDMPHVLHNLHVPVKKDLETIKGYQHLIQSVKKQIEPNGRVFVRFSGTEPLVRISLQGTSQERLQSCAHQIADHLKQELK